MWNFEVSFNCVAPKGVIRKSTTRPPTAPPDCLDLFSSLYYMSMHLGKNITFIKKQQQQQKQNKTKKQQQQDFFTIKVGRDKVRQLGNETNHHISRFMKV